MRTTQSGFQILEVIIAASILLIVVGSVIALSITSSRTIQKSADVLFAISLAQLTMEKVLGQPYDQISDDMTLYRLYANQGGGGAIDPFLDFQPENSAPNPTGETSQMDSLLRQISDLNMQYQVRVTELGPPDAYSSKQVLVVISWENSGNTLEYKLSGFISKKS